jgi:zinc protease
MFKGTATIGPTEFSRTVSRNGGRDNAYTSFDATGYHQTIAADRLELIMRMEADRMANLRISEKELTPERQVVLEERRMRVDNVPAELLDEAVREQLFGHGRPYGMPTAGYAADVKKLSVTDLTNFYRKYYAPNNAVLIVAGDTTAAAVAKLAEKYYGPIARGRAEPRGRPADGGAGLPQRVIRADARVVEPNWSRDFIAPSYAMGETRHADALLVLAQLFGGGETSRLWKALVVEAKLALSASAGYGASSLGLSSFEISVHPAPQRTIAEIEGAVADQMKKVLDGEVTPEEVERTQNRLLASAIYSQDSLGSGPRLYASILSTGGTINDIDAWPQRIAAVRPEHVVAAAQHVWRDEGAVTSLLSPAEGSK